MQHHYTHIEDRQFRNWTLLCNSISFHAGYQYLVYWWGLKINHHVTIFLFDSIDVGQTRDNLRVMKFSMRISISESVMVICPREADKQQEPAISGERKSGII
ncbi:MAG: hypothetical protein BAJATHORv1_20495 [Candidatus Thorarchaeota archaeon]|nr:MAG: hypothetical protein BAJATHORv1_20495 [Candidatus Thorarchaeota archaeon]